MKNWILFMTLCMMASTAHAQSGTSSTLTGISSKQNPAISVNGLFLGQTSTDNPSTEANQVNLQEAEIQFTSVVDPFWKANLTFAMHPVCSHVEEDSLNIGEHEDDATTHFDLEEAYLDALFMPSNLSLRAGKFLLPFGKHIPLHTHQFPFVYPPVAVAAFTGHDSPSEIGAELGFGLPLPWWSDVQVYGVNGDSEFLDKHDRDLAYGGRWSNLWDTSDNSTFEFGSSALEGPTGAGNLWLYGVDATWKWISTGRSRGPALTLQTEFIFPDPEIRSGDPYGFFALAQYRFHRIWWAAATVGQARDYSMEDDEPDDPLHETWETKFNLTFVPSEFSAIRAEVALIDDRVGDADEVRFLLQANFTIGSHPAHLY